MREIKFRVWHKNEKRWLDPWAEEDPILSLKDCGEGCEVFLYERDSGDWSNKNCLMKDIVIQQYTGLKDKNGVEIYEGDLILSDHWASQGTMVVKWDQDACMFYACLLSGGDLINMDEAEKTVVGNIFEGVDK
jgi:uncharacterized phage protein (TIGR01671 family)